MEAQLRRLALLVAAVSFFGFGAAAGWSFYQAHSMQDTVSTLIAIAKDRSLECLKDQTSLSCEYVHDARERGGLAIIAEDQHRSNANMLAIAALGFPAASLFLFFGGRWVITGQRPRLPLRNSSPACQRSRKQGSMLCSQCGAESQLEACFCHKCGANFSGNPRQTITAVVSKDSEPAIWNPKAAVNWSLIFTPAFGAYLQMLNWQTLGEPEKAGSSRNWFYVSLAILGVYIVMPILTFRSEVATGGVQLLGFVFLVVWYYSSGLDQCEYVEQHFGRIYPRRPWMKVLLIGAVASTGYLIVSAPLLIAVAKYLTY